MPSTAPLAGLSARSPTAHGETDQYVAGVDLAFELIGLAQIREREV
jgi:hypothetical protein